MSKITDVITAWNEIVPSHMRAEDFQNKGAKSTKMDRITQERFNLHLQTVNLIKALESHQLLIQLPEYHEVASILTYIEKGN